MATETYPISAFTTSNGAVALDALTSEVNADAGITAACLGATKTSDDVTLDFDAALDAPQKTALDAVVAAHTATALPEPVETVQLTNTQIDGTPQFVLAPRLGREVIYATHNFCDETTWYTDSARVTDEALTEGDGLTYDLAQVCVINMREGKVFDEEGLIEDQAIQNPGDPHAYEVVVKVDGVTMAQCDPFEDDTNDFHVDYVLGKIVFHASKAGKAVTASYSYKDGAGWEMRPTPGMSLAIEEAEVQFSVDVNFNTTLVMEVFGAVDFFAPYLMAEPYNFPSGTPIPISNTLYKTVYQLIDEAIGAKPPIPIFPNSDAKRAPQEEIHVFTFRYTVTKPMFSSLGMFTRIRMESGVAMPGERTTATFYLTAHEDPDPMVAIAKLTGG